MAATGVGFQPLARFLVGASPNFASREKKKQGFLIQKRKQHRRRSWRRGGINLLLAAQTQTGTHTIPHTCSSSTSRTREGWVEFAEKVSGEWDGHGADFGEEGEPVELPESVVPEAYREWEVKVYDWQTQCPTLAQSPHPFHLSYKLIKLLPTVGCEADAATAYSILHRNVLVNTNDNHDDRRGGKTTTASAFAYQSDGCYVAVWASSLDDGDGDHTTRALELEHCLVDPRDPHSRVRIIQEVMRTNAAATMQLQGIKVFREQWYGPFQNGEQLGGCATRDSAFASTPALQPSQISGTWHAFRHAVATFHHNSSPQAVRRPLHPHPHPHPHLENE